MLQSRPFVPPQASFALLAASLALGCGQSVQFAEVQGRITVNSKPAVCVVVRFYPIGDEREQLPYSTAMTDAAGRFTLTHDGDKPGAVVGLSRVVVQWPARDMFAAYGNGLKPSPPIPMRYTVASETPLKVEVKAATPGTPQTIDLELKN